MVASLNLCFLIVLLDFVGKNSSVNNNFGFSGESSTTLFTSPRACLLLSGSYLDCILPFDS